MVFQSLVIGYFRLIGVICQHRFEVILRIYEKIFINQSVYG